MKARGNSLYKISQMQKGMMYIVWNGGCNGKRKRCSTQGKMKDSNKKFRA
jgi:hypothetical protein